MNIFLENIKEVSSNIIPLLGAIALVAVIVFTIELIKSVKSLTKVLNKTGGTVDLVDESIKKAQAPLDTIVKVSHTVDLAHDATIKGIGEAKDFLTKNAEILKDKINEFTNKEDKAELCEPDPDDILKGE